MLKNKFTAVSIMILMVLLFCMGAVSQTQPGKTQPAVSAGEKVIVYYFHGNYRCTSCMTIERYTRESIEANFAGELKSGRLEFRRINVEQPANDHYIKDYKLFTRSVVISDTVQGKEARWKNLQRVWELLRNEREFKNYVKSETAAYLEGRKS